MAQEIFYKIRRRTDGLFSTGGHYPDFSKKGKIWRTFGHLRNHLGQLAPRKEGDSWYEDCEIVELITTENVIGSIDGELENMEQRKYERERQAQERWQREKETMEKKKLIELLEKYPEFESVSTAGKIIKRGV